MDRSETAYLMYTLRWLKECEKDFSKREQINKEKRAYIDSISAMYSMLYCNLRNRLLWAYGTDYTDVLESYVSDTTITNNLENAFEYANKLEG